MCGRFVLESSFEKIQSISGCHAGQTTLQLSPSWNIAPSDRVLTIYKKSSLKECTLMHWGFIPHWAKDNKISPINARGETISDKPFFRSAFRHQRCLIFADGFFEWQQTEHGKQAYYIQLNNQQPFTIAGIWDSYREQESMALITTTANTLMQPIHARMPAIIPSQYRDIWLDTETPVKQLTALLSPFSAAKMLSYPVSQAVNSPRNNFKALINRI
jgi:putative SOS response-associated peptidase YedK